MRAQNFGYWLKVHDQESAEQATRMAGLPSLLLGVIFSIQMLIVLLRTGALAPQGWVILGAGLLFIALGFWIRSGRFALMPVWVTLQLAILGSALAFNLYLATAPGGPDDIAGTIVGTYLPILLVLLSIAGLRGWLWLWRNKVPMRP